jgi:hypothetical protein
VVEPVLPAPELPLKPELLEEVALPPVLLAAAVPPRVPTPVSPVDPDVPPTASPVVGEVDDAAVPRVLFAPVLPTEPAVPLEDVPLSVDVLEEETVAPFEIARTHRPSLQTSKPEQLEHAAPPRPQVWALGA